MDRFINFHPNYLFDTSTKLFLSKKSKCVVNPYSKDFKRAVKNSGQLVKQLFDAHPGINPYSILLSSSGNTTAIRTDLTDKAELSNFWLCLSCNAFCSKHKSIMSTHFKHCSDTRDVITVSGYNFKISKQMKFLILDPTVSIIPVSYEPVSSSILLPNPAVECSGSDLDPEIEIPEPTEVELMDEFEQLDLQTLKDLAEAPDFNTSESKFLKLAYSLLLKQIDANNQLNANLANIQVLQSSNNGLKSNFCLKTILVMILVIFLVYLSGYLQIHNLILPDIKSRNFPYFIAS